MNEVQQVKHVKDTVLSIHLDENKVKRLQTTNPLYKAIIVYMHDNKITSYLCCTSYSQGILCNIVQDNDKIFDASVVTKTVQKYILHECHPNLGT